MSVVARSPNYENSIMYEVITVILELAFLAFSVHLYRRTSEFSRDLEQGIQSIDASIARKALEVTA